MPEDVARFTVLLEDIQTQVRAIADGHAGLTERMDRMEARFERFDGKVDGLEIKVGVLAAKVDGLQAKVDGLQAKVDGVQAKVDGLETKFEGFAGDTRHRLERIETHLALNGPLLRRRAERPATPRRRKKTVKPS
jgi:peptidoglycan hydrolase CwlO-like protein